MPPAAEDDVGASAIASGGPWACARCRAPLGGDHGDGGFELVAETLGEHVYDFFLANKRAEWADYRRQVTQFELDRYLRLL